LLADLGSRLSLSDATAIFFVGQIGKYLPGAVWPVMAQVRLSRMRNVPAAAAGASALLALGLSVVAGLLVALVALPLTARDALGGYAWVYLSLPVALLLLHPSVLNKVFTWALALMHRPPLPQPLTGKGMVRALVWFCLQWLLIGVGVWLLVRGVGGTDLRALPLAVGGYALAWVAGFLVLFVPAGAGVRESVLTVLLVPVLPLSGGGGLLVALVMRLLLTVADIAWGLVGLRLVGSLRAELHAAERDSG